MKKRGVNGPRRPFEDAPKRSNIGPGPKPGPKRAVNVSVDAEILAAAKDLGLNLSLTLENELRKMTVEERIRRWQEENREAIESQNAYFERNGTLTEAWLKEQSELPDPDDPTV